MEVRNHEADYRRWPVWLTAAVSMLLTLGAWHAVSTAQSNHVRRMTQLAASAVRADFISDNEAWLFGLVRLAKLWESSDGPSYDEWKASAELFIQHNPGCLAVEWLRPTSEERWLVRAPSDASSSIVSNEIRDLLNRAAATRKPLLGPARISRDGTVRRAMVVPIYREPRFEGFVIALTDVSRSYASMMSDVATLGYSFAVREGGAEIYRVQGSTPDYEKQWGQTFDVSIGGVLQQISVWPTAAVLGEIRTKLPAATLAFGALLGGLLALIVFQGQKVRSRSVHLHQANQKLVTAIDEQRRIEAALRSSQSRFSGILEISADAVISVDENLLITLFNQGAEDMFGYRQQEILGRPLETLVPPRYREIHRKHTQHFAESDQATMRMSQRRAVFGLRKDGSEFPMEASLAKLKLEEGTCYTAIVRDVTERMHAQEELRRSRDELELRVRERTAELQEVSSRLLRLQDEERRRIARELHDGTTQTLIALGLDLKALNKMLGQPEPRVQHKLSDAKELVDQCLNEIRTVSYLLHPPLLDGVGLDCAIRNYVEGFSRRSNIQVDLRLSDLGALSRDVELAIFRVVQESLANIHRHSGSPTASIVLERQNGTISLEVSDQGCGIPIEVLRGSRGFAGVGIAGMRERVRQLGGQCEIQSQAGGTQLRVVLPVTDDDAFLRVG